MQYRLLRSSQEGFTLIEIMIALTIFAVTLGVAAQGLTYGYSLVRLQTQRVVAANDCRVVISGLRNVVAADPDTAGCPDTANKFPCLILEYVSTFPANASAVSALPTATKTFYAGLYTLRGETITISLTSPTGGTVVNGNGPSSSTNPVYVKVTVQWTGPRGIKYSETASTIITSV